MQLRIEMIYKTKKGLETSFSSEEMPIKSAIMLAEDLVKTGRVHQLSFIDEEEIQTEPHHISVYFDGGFDHPTGKAGLGCVIYYEQNEKEYRMRKNAMVDELTSSNEAEYAALHFGLKELELLGAHHMPITFIGDSKVVINQLNDEWPVYDATLNNWIDLIEKKQKQLGITPRYKEISRKQNREADHLAAQALEGIEVESQIELE